MPSQLKLVVKAGPLMCFDTAAPLAIPLYSATNLLFWHWNRFIVSSDAPSSWSGGDVNFASGCFTVLTFYFEMLPRCWLCGLFLPMLGWWECCMGVYNKTVLSLWEQPLKIHALVQFVDQLLNRKISPSWNLPSQLGHPFTRRVFCFVWEENRC